MESIWMLDGNENALIDSLCKGAVKTVKGRNGLKISHRFIADKFVEIITKKAFTHLDYYVLLSDLENRESKYNFNAIDCENLLLKTVIELIPESSRPFYIPKIIIGVADRKVENWLYTCITAKSIDGSDGNRMIEKLVPNYQKSTGPLACKAHSNFSLRNALASPSFRRFAEKLRGLGCEEIDAAFQAENAQI